MENNETKINEEMRELTDEELAQVTGGRTMPGAGGTDSAVLLSLLVPAVPGGGSGGGKPGGEIDSFIVYSIE